MVLLLIGLAAAAAALLGGALAFRFQDRLHLMLGFSAGAVLGVAFFDLIPEAVELYGGDVGLALTLVCLAFFAYMTLDRIFLLHRHGDDEDCRNPRHTLNPVRGRFGAGSLSAHSFLDGLAIGVAFQAAPALGFAVAAAVFAHGFSDGVNTVTIIRRHGGSGSEALKWLLLDAAAPFLGVMTALVVVWPAAFLPPFLALFAGFFLYLGGSDLLPESHHRHPTHWTTAATLFGVAAIWLIIRLLGV